MGNKESSSQSNEIVHVNHPYFGEIQLITHQGLKYMKISMVSDGKRSLQEWQKNQELLRDMNVEPLLLAVDHKFQEQGMCGSTGVLHILYQNHPVILRDEILNRREQPQHFHESEIWYLLHILVSSAAEFHKRESRLGDIRPGNIFINEEGQVKLANVCSWPRQQISYLKSLNDKEETYLAPEEMAELQKNNFYPETDRFKAQSFSIGLTLLDAITLNDSATLYNFQNCTFNISGLQQQLAELHTQTFYSPFLKEIVSELLAIDPNIRKSAEQVYQKILPYEYNIKNLIAFVPNLPVPIIHGSKSVVSSYSNTLPFKTSNIGVGLPESVYQARNTGPYIAHRVVGTPVSLPVTTITHSPNPYISKEYSVNYTPVRETQVGNYTQSYRSINDHLPNSSSNKMPVQSRQQLWEEIDKQIERSKKLFQ